MKRIIALFAVVFAVTSLSAQTDENFNSRPNAVLSEVKNDLQMHCWQFHDFDINNGGWDPAIEGDGAMVSGPGASPNQNAGIFSQQLSCNGSIQVSFKYKFIDAVTDRRWLKILTTDEHNNILIQMDSIELTGSNNSTVYTYNKVLSTKGSGCYKIFINYAGINGENRIAIDELHFNAPSCFSNGCNQPPVAVNDYVAGTANYTAEGSVLPNDMDPENSVLSTTLLTNSPDGDVVLTDYGHFTFTPKPGFKGVTTSFTYISCDAGGLCSEPATVLITFQTQSTLPVTLIDFGAIYKNDKVNVKWTSTFELNNDRYEVERSMDGVTFSSVGTVKGLGNSSVKHEYQFNDDVSKNVLNRNDLYYRLKQVDLNGRATFTKVLVVRVYRTKTLQSLSVTPNPAINDIRVNVQLNENAYIVLKIANSSGIEVMRKTTRGSNGTNSLRLEGTSKLQAGVYFLEVIVNSNERMNVKLIKS
ncbi:MAG TPA: Ig-like domain-containing protein [Chitinophagaceae bacterium]|nr:Ig-like domain-containing protein [Chitinophagaceae bacterium]